jgi:outer membrane protein OmpA-like peptidoglycan-associated protein
VTLKANNSSFGGKSYGTYSTDVGLLWAVASNLDLGASYSNLKFGGSIAGTELSNGFRLGAGWHVYKHWLVSAATELQPDGLNRMQLGTEYLVGDVSRGTNVLALRGGYAYSFPNNQLGLWDGLSIGVGYAVSRQFAVDYAFLPAGELGYTNRLSLTFKFGCPHHEVSQRAAAAAAPANAPVAPKVIIAAGTLEDAHFDFDKATLKPSTESILKENAKILKDHPNSTVEVSGYSSAMGTVDYNQKLSEQRAKAVSDYFVKEGVDPARITTIGYGETRPRTIEANPEDGRSKAAKSNMRVIFVIAEQK